MVFDTMSADMSTTRSAAPPFIPITPFSSVEGHKSAFAQTRLPAVRKNPGELR
jgi:hypothetical protein